MNKQSTFYCAGHQATMTVDHSDMTTGYATNDKGEKFCYECCATTDRKWMDEHGKIALYLTMNPEQAKPGMSHLWHTFKVTNWPCSLSFNVVDYRKGYHNIARTRHDVWFHDHNGHIWHGVQYGDNTQIVHCKRLRQVKVA